MYKTKIQTEIKGFSLPYQGGKWSIYGHKHHKENRLLILLINPSLLCKCDIKVFHGNKCTPLFGKKVRGQKQPGEVDKCRKSIPHANHFILSKCCQRPVEDNQCSERTDQHVPSLLYHISPVNVKQPWNMILVLIVFIVIYIFLNCTHCDCAVSISLHRKGRCQIIRMGCFIEDFQHMGRRKSCAYDLTLLYLIAVGYRTILPICFEITCPGFFHWQWSGPEGYG